MKQVQLILTSILWMMSVTVARADVIVLAADEWCPYNCAPGANPPGFGIEIAKYAFERAGHTVEYKVMPWNRAIETARKGEATAIIGAIKEDAPDFVFPEHPITDTSNSFYVLKGGGWNYQGIESLSKVTLGAVLDYSYGDELDAYLKAHKSSEKRVQLVGGNNALDQNVRKLQAGRITVVLEDSNVMAMKLKELKLNESIVSAGNVGVQKAYIAFSPKNPKSGEYTKILDAAITEMHANGKMQEIMSHYAP